MKKILTAVLLFISFASFGQSGVDSTTINTSTPMAAKQYQFKYLKIDSGLSVRKRFFAKDSAFFSGKTYALTLPASGDSSNQVPNTKWVKQELASVGIGDTAGRWVYAITKNATADSIVYYRGGVRYAVKDSIGTGSFARDTIVAGRGLTGTPITATKVQIDNDSAIYIVTQINDTTLSFTHYDGRIDTVTIVSSGGGGGSYWGLAGSAITTGQFLGTTNNEPLVFKFNGIDRGIISVTNIAFGSFINAGVGNAGFGDDALLSATSNTNYNTALGAISLQVLDNGNDNTAVGHNSLSGITAGKANTAIGAETTLATISSTDSSIAIGYEAVASTKQLAFSPHVTEIKATGITGASNSGYVLTTNGSGIATFQAAGGGSSLTGNLTYVDAVNGNDGTAVLGDFTKPFLTLGAAVTAATPGYTIVVRPGSYSNATQLLKDSVDWYFMPNTKVSQTNATGTAMFDDSGGFDAVCKITGYGVFIDTLGGEACILKVEDAASNIYFEAQSISVGNGNTNVGITMANGNVIANIRGTLGSGTISSSTYDAIIVTGGTLNLTADKIISTGATEGNAIEVTGGTVNIKCMEYRTTGAYDAFGSTSAIAYSGGNATIEGEGVAELSDGLVVASNGTGVLTLRGKLTSTSKTAVVYLSAASGKTLINQATLISNTSFDSIDAPSAQTVVSYGSFANKAVDANITIQGILTIGSYVQ